MVPIVQKWLVTSGLVVIAAALTTVVFAAPTPVDEIQAPPEIPPPATDWRPDPDQARQLYSRAETWLRQDQPKKALDLLRRAMALETETNPSNRPYYAMRAAIFAQLGEQGPTKAIEFYNQGLLATNRGDFAEARACYDRALTIDPDQLWAANNRAWLGSTHPDPRARNDPDVVAYALFACVKSNWRNWSFIDTLSAAYAERQDFPAAIRCAKRAISLAPPEYHDELNEATEAYRQGRPRRQTPPAEGPEAMADLAAAEDPFVLAAAEDPFAADDAEEKIKQKHREIYLEFLTQQGYRPEVDKEGDVTFKKEGGVYFISVSDDPNFFKVVYPAFFKIESADEQFRALKSIEQVGREVKVVKLIVIRDRVWAMAESFVPDQATAPKIFDDSVLAIRVGVQLFGELMDEER